MLLDKGLRDMATQERRTCEDRAKVGVMLPQAKEHLLQPEGGRDRNYSSLNLSARGCPADTLISDLKPPEL